MELFFEVIFQLLGEVLLQIVFELLAEIGMRGLAGPFERPRNSVVATIGCLLWGAIAGGLSLLVLPTLAIRDPSLRILNLVATPLAAGGAMMMVGHLRDRRGETLVRLDRFAFAFAFALAMALVRYIGAR